MRTRLHRTSDFLLGLSLAVALVGVMLAAMSCGGGGGGGNSGPTSPPTVTAVSVSCNPTALGPGQTSQCTAAVAGTGSYSSSVTWSASAGTINSSGMFTPPASTGAVTVTATSGQDSTKSGNTSVTVMTTATTISAVAVACNPTSVAAGQTSQCAATVTGTGTYSSSVTWSASAGTINSSGLLTAPASAGTVTVTAKSAQDTTQSGKTSVTVTTTTITSVSVSCNPTSVATGHTSQCTATVAGTGSYSSAVNWSVSGIQGGNSTVGTISSSGLYTAPSALPSANPVTVTATSTADPTKLGSAELTITVSSSAVAITFLSTTSPLPLSPITINTSGVDPNSLSTISLQFSDSSGFSVTESPISVNTSGSMMIAGVPLYVSPSTGTTGPDTMSLVLTQGSKSSPPVTVNVQDLPSVSSYGATPGQISHATLVLEAMMIGRRLNQLQAFQALPGNTVETTQAQSTLGQLLSSAISARSDVDGVTAKPSLVVPTGATLPNGSPIQFDQTALDMMDRINGLLVSEVFTASPPASPSARRRRTSRRPAIARSGRVQRNTATDIFTGIDLITNIPGYEQAILAAYNANGFNIYTAGIYAKALSQTIGTSLAYSSLAPGGEALGAYGAIFNMLPTLGMFLGSDTAWIQAWINGDTATMATAESAMQEGQADFYANMLGLYAAGVPNSQTLSEIAGLATGSAGASTVAGLVTAWAQLQNGSQGDQIAPIDLQSIPLSNTTPPSSPTQGIATVDGTITVPDQGISTPQSELEFCCINDLAIIGIVDADGDFEFFMPLGVASTNYSNLTLNAINPLTGGILGSETVDLSGLDTTTPIAIPTLTTSSTPPPTSGFQLTTFTSGGGQGTVYIQNMTGGSDLGASCGTGCYAYPAGTLLSITDAPALGSTFIGWSGACSGTGACSVTMNSNQSVTAAFDLQALLDLDLSTAGTGSGTVTPNPAGGSCGTDCYSYTSGTAVQLTAIPSSGSTFAGWSGACSGTGACSVTMNSNQSVTATFNTSGGSSPGAGNYAGTCTATGTPITCCADGICSTVPAPSPVTEPINFTLAPGTSLSTFTSDICTDIFNSLSAAGCASPSCSNTAATSSSASFTLSCSNPPVAGCTTETVTETCSMTLQ